MVNKQKVLIVDDDNNIAELIALYLTKECYETMIVNDGESVMPAMESFSPNLILLDIMLPGMDGYQVCREVRNKYSVPIIMLSAKGEIFDKVLGLELGADDYIEKPFDTKELVARAAQIFDWAIGMGWDHEYGRPRALPVRFRGQMRAVRGPLREPDQLFRALHGAHHRHAAKGAGAIVFPGLLPQPCVHQGAAAGPDLGIRVRGGHPHRGRAHQAPPGEDQGPCQLEDQHHLGRGL